MCEALQLCEEDEGKPASNGADRGDGASEGTMRVVREPWGKAGQGSPPTPCPSPGPVCLLHRAKKQVDGHQGMGTAVQGEPTA